MGTLDLLSNVVDTGIAPVSVKPVRAIWSGPHGYSPDNDRQVTLTDPGTSWVDGTGATAADNSEPDSAAFKAEFPTAIPGLLYGIVVVGWGNFYHYIGDMYNVSDTSTREYRDRESWAYDSGSFCLKRLFEARSNSGGMWDITFAKPIPFYLGLRSTYDNGSSMIYFLYSLGLD